jgi:hypothetical protein
MEVLQMWNETERRIRYKWDPHTDTGYQLRYDALAAAKGGHRCWRVEDWTCHTVTSQWQCESLDEALGVLNGLFCIDPELERRRLRDWPQGGAESRAAA